MPQGVGCPFLGTRLAILTDVDRRQVTFKLGDRQWHANWLEAGARGMGVPPDLATCIGLDLNLGLHSQCKVERHLLMPIRAAAP